MSRLLAAALAALALTGCTATGRDDTAGRAVAGDAGAGSVAASPTAERRTFCETVAALNDSAVGRPGVFLDEHSSEEEIRAATATLREAVDRHVALLDRLEETAPADLRADVALVADLGREFARTMVSGGLGALTERMLSDYERSQRTFRAYRVVQAATAKRCGVRLDLDAELPVPP